MKRLTAEWIEKAEEDYLVAVELACSRKLTPYNVICFHCQQEEKNGLKPACVKMMFISPKRTI